MLRASVIGGVQYVVSVESRSKYAHSAATRRSRCDYIARTNQIASHGVYPGPKAAFTVRPQHS